MSRIREAQGDFDGALELLGEAERVYEGGFFPNVRPIAAMKARVWVVRGMLGEALGWARERGLSVGDDLSYLREFEHITLTRLLLAQYKSEHIERLISDAIGLLVRLLKAAEEGGRGGSIIEILILQALVHQTQGDTPAALVPLERALALAAPAGYVRMFVDEGTPMAQLLQEAVTHRTMPEYAGRLLAALSAQQQESTGESPLPTSSVPAAARALIEPLSERELEVLRLFRSELTGPEMARELVIALSTLRTHTKRIYSKLDVNSRRAAIKRAAELGLI